MHEVTELLLSWRQGDAAALDRLIPVVYDELRRVARRRLRGESPGHALQSTALVHEVYLRLVDVDRMTLKSRTHFFALAARLMRQILVDHARRQHADKRGGRVTMVSLDDVSPAAQPSSVDVLALDEALAALSSLDDRQCRVVELRFFAGLNIDEAAEALSVSPATVEREWALAKAWLYRRLSSRTCSSRESRAPRPGRKTGRPAYPAGRAGGSAPGVAGYPDWLAGGVDLVVSIPTEFRA